MKQLFLFLTTMLLSLTASAETVEIDGIYYNLNPYEMTAGVSSNPNGYSGDVVIPAVVNYEDKNYDVTSIGNSAFNGCSGLSRITIPNSVTSIKYAAFKNCSGLISVTIPGSVKNIESNAFEGCDGLTSMTIPNGVTSIGAQAFRGCTGLTSVHITSLVAWCQIQFGTEDSNPLYFAKHLYLNGIEIRELLIPDEVTTIGQCVFSGCIGLTSVTIPNSVTTIGSSAFHECSGLISVTIPKSVKSIGEYAFSGCNGLISLTIPDGVTSIGKAAFMNCSGLTSVTIPESVTSIGSYAFYYCSSLTSVTIPNGVKSIGQSAFYGCSGLTSVAIPSSVTTIGDDAFRYCISLTSIIIPNGVTSIGNYAFDGCSSLTSINIPNSVTSIGEGAFHSCSLLNELQLPDKLKIIKKATFQNCGSIKSVIIPASIEYIYSEAFAYCWALESIKALPENPPFIYDNTFSNYSVPLIVPQGCKEAYQSAQGWKNFTDISDSRYKLTYMVDGEEYKSFIIESGTAITPEPEPTKDTYKFSGWSEIPETMPNHDVVITGTFERYFDVGHLAKVINFVMKSNASASDVALFDLNNDEELNIGDIILIVKNILNHNSSNSPAAVGRRAGEIIDLTQYTAAQFEVKMADGKEIKLVSSMDQTHQLMYQKKDENTYAVVVFSLSNQLMTPENGSIIEMDGVESSIQNVVLAKPNGETDCYHGLPVSTGIQQIENGTSSAVIYDLKGNRLNSVKALDKGIYIVNGKKAVVR